MIKTWFDGIIRLLARTPLAFSPRLAGVALELPVSPEDPHLRVHWTIDGVRSGGSVISVIDTGPGALAIRDVEGDVAHASRTRRGFVIELQDGSATARLQWKAEWIDRRRPLDYPADFPQQIRDLSSPEPLVRARAVATGNATVSSISAHEDDESEFELATFSFGKAGAGFDLEGTGLRVRLMGADWTTLAADAVQRVIDRLRVATREVAASFEGRPRGEMQLRLTESTDAIGAGGGTAVYYDRAWLEGFDYPAAALLRWQMSRLWWGGLMRIVGPDGPALEVALRSMAIRTSGQQRFDRVAEVASSPALSSAIIGSVSTSRRRRAHALRSSLSDWLERDPSASNRLRTLAGELFGRVVHEQWVLDKLRTAGARL